MAILSKVWKWLSKFQRTEKMTRMERVANAEESVIVILKTSDNYEGARERLAFLREQADNELERIKYDKAFRRLAQTPSGHLYREGVEHVCGIPECPEYSPKRPGNKDHGR